MKKKQKDVDKLLTNQDNGYIESGNALQSAESGPAPQRMGGGRPETPASNGTGHGVNDAAPGRWGRKLNNKAE